MVFTRLYLCVAVSHVIARKVFQKDTTEHCQTAADRKSLRTGCPHPQGCQPHHVLSLPAAQQQWRHGCIAGEMEAQRVSSLRLLEFLFSAEIHQDLSSLLYFSAPSCDVNTYAGIHLHFKRTSSHGVRATGCFSRCCRP